MAQGPLRFRTPFIEELPVTQSRQAPGFAWVAVSGPAAEDPAKNWGTSNRKRSTRTTGGNETTKEATTARHRTEVEKRLRELNTDGTAQVAIPKSATSVGAGGGATKAGKTSNTKKILSSGKTFAHYLDDEEAEIALRGRRDVDVEIAVVKEQRASKTPIARRKPQLQAQESNMSASPGPSSQPGLSVSNFAAVPMDIDDDGDMEGLEPMPSQAEIQALLDAPPLTYNQARSAPPPSSAPPRRKFCEICGYWGRVKCMKCGHMTCSVMCKEAHDEHKCLKFYA